MKDVLIKLMKGKIFEFFWYLNDLVIIKPKDSSVFQKDSFIVIGRVLVYNLMCPP